MGETGNTHRILMENHITPRGRVPLDKLAAPYPVKKLPAFYKNPRFIIVYTKAHHLSMFWARSVDFMPPTDFLKNPFNIILPFKARFSKWIPSVIFPHHNNARHPPFYQTCYMSHPSHNSCCDLSSTIRWGVHLAKPFIMHSPPGRIIWKFILRGRRKNHSQVDRTIWKLILRVRIG